jgi:DNA-binding PadR family transcriptional regulator
VPDVTLTTTSYGMLGYLAVRPWTAYELAKQMGRTFHHFWPRAESGLYREIKRLVDAGLATASDERVGRRTRTRYDITPAGRAALEAWLARPNSNGFLESEGLVRVLFATYGTKAALLELLDVIEGDATGIRDQMLGLVRDYLVTGGQFPRRSHINVLIAKFLIEFSTMVGQWAAWSRSFVDTWPDTQEHDPEPATMARYREIVDAYPLTPRR